MRLREAEEAQDQEATEIEEAMSLTDKEALAEYDRLACDSLCSVPTRDDQWLCTLETGHGGEHVACDGEMVLERWPNHDDPPTPSPIRTPAWFRCSRFGCAWSAHADIGHRGAGFGSRAMSEFEVTPNDIRRKHGLWVCVLCGRSLVGSGGECAGCLMLPHACVLG